MITDISPILYDTDVTMSSKAFGNNQVLIMHTKQHIEMSFDFLDLLKGIEIKKE